MLEINQISRIGHIQNNKISFSDGDIEFSIAVNDISRISAVVKFEENESEIKLRRLGQYRMINGNIIHITEILENENGDYMYYSPNFSMQWFKNGKLERDDLSKPCIYDVCEVISEPQTFVR